MLSNPLLALLQRGSPSGLVVSLALSVLTPLLVAGATRLRMPLALARWTRRAAPPRPLLRAAREQFLRLQSAWDAADLDTLRRLTTEDMFEELAAELPARGHEPNRTDVLALEAHLIAFECVGPLELASIEFSGVVRESARRGPAPFREVWMLARQPGGETWRLARQQALM